MTRNYLNHAESYQLIEWLKEAQANGSLQGMTRENVLNRAIQQLGFIIRPMQLKTAAKIGGVTLPVAQPKKNKKPRIDKGVSRPTLSSAQVSIRRLATALVLLMEELGTDTESTAYKNARKEAGLSPLPMTAQENKKAA